MSVLFALGASELPPDRVLAVLQREEWKIQRAARRLGISRFMLYRLMDRYGIHRPS